MRVVILVPRRADNGRRDDLWLFTKTWLTQNHPEWPIIEGASPEGPFNRGAAINDAARIAGDWDVAVITDGDNICSPAKLVEAVQIAADTGNMIFPGDTYCYLDEESSDQIMSAGGPGWWPRPQIYRSPNRADQTGYTPYLIHKHVSGIQAIRRDSWDLAGGFAELTGWGSEDSIFWTTVEAAGIPINYLTGPIFHLFHEHAAADITPQLRSANRRALSQVQRVARTNPRNVRQQIAELQNAHTSTP